MSNKTQSAEFSSLPFFVYPVTDMNRARVFYRDVIGLAEGDSWDDKWVEFNVGAGVLALSSVMQGATPGAKGGAAALETDRFDEVVGRFRKSGVQFVLEPVDTGVCAFARFEDPDGNHLILHRKHKS